MLTTAHRASFSDQGCCHIPGLLDANVVGAARAMVERALTRAARGIPPDAPRERWGTATRATLQAVRSLRHTPPIAALEQAELQRIAEALCAWPTWRVTPHPQLLVTPRNCETWYVPHDVWHTDTPRLTGNPLPGVQAFLLLSDITPGGGGTLIASGSQRLPADGRFPRSKQIKSALRRHPWFRDLLRPGAGARRRFIDHPGEADGVELQVVELCGQAGDVYFTDLRLLHTPAPNAHAATRIMATQRYASQRFFNRRFVPLETLGEDSENPSGR